MKLINFDYTMTSHRDCEAVINFIKSAKDWARINNGSWIIRMDISYDQLVATLVRLGAVKPIVFSLNDGTTWCGQGFDTNVFTFLHQYVKE